MKNMGNSGIWEKGLGLGLVVCLTLTSSPPCLSPVSTIFLSKTPVHLCIKNASGIEACASFDLWASNLTYDNSQPVCCSSVARRLVVALDYCTVCLWHYFLIFCDKSSKD